MINFIFCTFYLNLKKKKIPSCHSEPSFSIGVKVRVLASANKVFHDLLFSPSVFLYYYFFAHSVPDYSSMPSTNSPQILHICCFLCLECFTPRYSQGFLPHLLHLCSNGTLLLRVFPESVYTHAFLALPSPLVTFIFSAAVFSFDMIQLLDYLLSASPNPKFKLHSKGLGCIHQCIPLLKTMPGKQQAFIDTC